MSHVLVTGANGQLGRELKKMRNRFRQTYTFTDVEELDATNLKALKSYLASHPVDFIINCAAYTDVERAESEPDQAMKLNRDILVNFKNCLEEFRSVRIIHISTDYVYRGEQPRPIREDDPTAPLGVYARTKLEGENVLRGHPRALIVRTSWLYSVFGKNFVKNMINRMDQKSDLKVVYDQVGSPTYAEDLARAIMQIISDVESDMIQFVPGIFNYSNSGVCSWYDITMEICRMIGCRAKVIPIESHEFSGLAKRPAYTVMNKSRIQEVYGVDVPYWRISLERCIHDLI
ncbi:MAG: dTDP-4-dehydrorhamnose reductase [Bacteroidales bacterium]|nr:dTDP-4-dehydrorhamnose reductase [Bacteroidales bacterium]